MKFKSYSEAVRTLLGLNYYNAATKLKLLEYCKDNNIDIELDKDAKHYCLECGKEIKRRRKFCNSSCAAKYNNKRRVVSDEQKLKVSNTLKRKYNNGELIKKCRIVHTIEKKCPVCEKIFLGTKKQIYCSQSCVHKSPEIKEKLRQAQLRRVESGEHRGWQCRNISSYPEQFWETVLNNNDIHYERESFCTRKYFLDFYIEKNGKKIDLEIDGKQHTYKERIIHDKERDIYLNSVGFEVYRIPWNEINSEQGKSEMKTKIDKFLKYYNSL